jgi:23S rRNA (cytosine1962-C5)-methyltransferase
MTPKKPIHLRARNDAARRVKKGHPWLFENSILHQRESGNSGDVAVVYDEKRNLVGVGLFDPDSTIRVRVLSHGKGVAIDADFFKARIQAALARRQEALDADQTDGYRVVNGEGDGLGALVVDRYGGTLVIKIYSQAWFAHLEVIKEALVQALSPQRIVLRLARNLEGPAKKRHGIQDGMVLLGSLPSAPLLFFENGIRFEVDPIKGQKTGFFLDQRENRARVEALPHLEGASVLNAFAYSGGFSLYAARGGATRVVSLDQSAPALAQAEKHFALNASDPRVARCDHEIWCDDAFAAMAQAAGRGERFDVVIVDPPAFAKKADEVKGALAAYGRLVRLALDLLSPGGHLVMASCSSRVGAEAFFQCVRENARQAKRPLMNEKCTEHAVDHPAIHAEGKYLKCMFARA